MLSYILIVFTIIFGYAAWWVAKRTILKKKRKRAMIDAIVISGPSGAGKGTLIKMLLGEYPEKFKLSVSHTTRAPRDGEQNGVDYHFVSKAEMERMIANDEFAESCPVHDNYYGTSKKALEEVRSSGRVPIIEVDVKGAEKLKKSMGKLHYFFIFLKAPSLEVLEQRIRARGAEDSAKIQKRLETARAELEIADGSSLYDIKLVNDVLDNTYMALCRNINLFCGVDLKTKKK